MAPRFAVIIGALLSFPKGAPLMNLVLLDIDGTLTLSYEHDQESFRRALGDVTGRPSASIDLERYPYTTSTGVAEDALRDLTGRAPGGDEIEAVKRRVLFHLEQMHAAAPASFRQVPGADRFLTRLRRRGDLALAIATGCWTSEACHKLEFSGLHLDGIPMGTSDDDRDRRRVMEAAVRRAGEHYACPAFERIVYLGDGPWDLKASRALGFAFIGIGARLRTLQEAGVERVHADYRPVEPVLASIDAALAGRTVETNPRVRS